MVEYEVGAGGEDGLWGGCWVMPWLGTVGVDYIFEDGYGILDGRLVGGMRTG